MEGKSKREVELQKVFPDANEKLVKDFKCSLYLDIHHPGRMFLTQNHLYFYSTKNITDPLPNPLAVFSPFKELSGIEKSGIDGIIIRKGDEEITLDSFQYRNEVFDVIYRLYLQSKGGKVENVNATTEKKTEYRPVDVEVKELLKRTLDGLPFFNDLGLLSLNYQITDKGKIIFDGPSTGNIKNYERLKTLLFAVSSALDNSFNKSKIEGEFDKFFANAEDEKIKYSINPPTVTEFLSKNFGEDHITVRTLKACIHPVTYGVLRIKEALTSIYPTKDLRWGVRINLSDSEVTVLHLRTEASIKGLFDVDWNLGMTFDRTVKNLTKAWLNVTDLRFDGNTKEQIRYTIQTLLKEFLPATDPKYKNSIILPSFVDLSNQQLTAVPDFILDMKGIQTLYLHFNQIESLPDKLENLSNLQVLYLNQNKFSVVPPVVFKIKSLRELHLGRNKIQQIPPEIGILVNLRELSLSYNMLNGDLPIKELLKLTNLAKLYLHNNYLGNIPPELVTLPNLKFIQIHNNQKLTGKLKDFGPNDSDEIIAYLRNLNISK